MVISSNFHTDTYWQTFDGQRNLWVPICPLWSFFWVLAFILCKLTILNDQWSFSAQFYFDFVLSCTGLIAWRIVCRGKGLLLPASTLSNATRQVTMRRFRMFCLGWTRSVRTMSPSTTDVRFQLTAGQEVVVDLILFCHQTAVSIPNLANSMSPGNGVLRLSGPQSVMGLLAIIEQTLVVRG